MHPAGDGDILSGLLFVSLSCVTSFPAEAAGPRITTRFKLLPSGNLSGPDVQSSDACVCRHRPVPANNMFSVPPLHGFQSGHRATFPGEQAFASMDFPTTWNVSYRGQPARDSCPWDACLHRETLSACQSTRRRILTAHRPRHNGGVSRPDAAGSGSDHRGLPRCPPRRQNSSLPPRLQSQPWQT